MTIDGSDYFNSEKIHCENCLTKKTRSGGIRYYHQILQATLVHPYMKQVIPLAPEFIRNTDNKGRQHLYKWENDIPLNGNKKSIKVNYFEYSIIENGKINYHNSWVMDIPIDRDNVAQLVKAGRARWKIANEGFNTIP
jgi:hypothetical protein